MHETKQKILNASIQIIGEQGVTKLSAANLAKRAGISKANVFHHFPSIDQMLLESFENLLEQMFFSESFSANSTKQLLSHLGKQSLGVFSQHRTYLNAYYQFCVQASFSTEIQSSLTDSLSHFKKKLGSEFSRLGVSSKNSRTLASLTLNTLDGLMVHLLLSGDQEEFKKNWQLFVSMILSNLSKET